MGIKKISLLFMLLVSFAPLSASDIDVVISLKSEGQPLHHYFLEQKGNQLIPEKPLPLDITIEQKKDGADELLTLCVKAKADVYYNIGGMLNTALSSQSAEFYLPGLFYHQNMRSPAKAPSFKTSRSWNFREDRLSTPLTSVYDEKMKQGVSVMRILDQGKDCVVGQLSGEVILPGETSIGYLGFDAEDPQVSLTFGYPFMETPKRYVRKLSLVEAVMTFAHLKRGEQKRISWRIHTVQAKDFSDFVALTWCHSFDKMAPQPLTPRYTPAEMKSGLAQYFKQSYVDSTPLKYHSGISIQTATCNRESRVQLGFCGRVLLNAFNALEYGEQQQDEQLVSMGKNIFDSWLAHGITPNGWLIDDKPIVRAGGQQIHTIRQQSEGIYALLHYLSYEKKQHRKHSEWELRVRKMLDNMVAMQLSDGHFARKFKEDGTVHDISGGSTSSATSALVMGYVYFGDKKYLKAAERTVDYIEQNIINKSDYYSSTLDANCEDKEAAIAAVTATYYMAMVSPNKARMHYIDLCRKAAYFALSWYYTWDVPFAPEQLLGKLNFHTRGWGNVSVENNHVDVFVFELPSILKWLSTETNERRFEQMRQVIFNSLDQLLPTQDRLCGIAKPGYYPEVVQHTTWDYGSHGKGFYHRVFAPGWTVASLWEMYSPQRTIDYLKGK
ncbi:hypothetical protein [Segatella bryantii]|uniref:hypothetical protein n=1 Tax=Segatella bryantii TaxID=77095 RepID=UPI00242B95B5|nr:hypothetical protein [Segatella bryantii]